VASNVSEVATAAGAPSPTSDMEGGAQNKPRTTVAFRSLVRIIYSKLEIGDLPS
jgi:hypothetical protein